MSGLRIAYVVSLIEVPHGTPGGQGGTRHVMEVAQHLSRLGHQVSVFTAGRGTDVAVAEIEGISYYREFRGSIGGWNPKSDRSDSSMFAPLKRIIGQFRGRAGRIVRWFDSIRDVRRLAEQFERLDIDVVYERTTSYSTAGVRVANQINLPLVAEVNDLAQSDFVLRKADAIVVPEPNSLPEHLRSKSVRLPWGVDTAIFKPNSTISRNIVTGSSDGDPTIVFLGSFLPWHGAEKVVEVASILRDRLPNARYLMIGDGPNRGRIEASVREMKLSDVFDFRGRVPLQEVADVLNSADIGIAPYTSELGDQTGRAAMATPLKILEYMASALPVVTTSVANESGIIRDGVDGSDVEDDDEQALADAIFRYASDQELSATTGTSGRDRVELEYSWQSHTHQLTEIFEGVINSHRLTEL